MNFFITLLLSIFILVITYSLLKKTVFGIDFKLGNYPGFFIFYDFILYVIPSVLLLNLLPIENFWVAFKVKQNSVFWISMLILVSVFLFFLFLYLMSLLNNKKNLRLGYYDGDLNYYNVRFFVKFSLLFLLLVIVFMWIVLGVKHSLLSSFLTGVSTSTLRFEIDQNSYAKIFKHLSILIAPFLAAILGSSVYNKHLLERLIMVFLLLCVASWSGSKSPLLKVFIIFVISYMTFNNIKINVRIFLQLLIGALFMMVLVYQIVLLQYNQMEDLNLFFDYFFQRVFVAQMIGVYEEFNLWIHDFSYILHAIPFASSFVDVPIFQKDLMMISEDRIDPSSIGIKNTLFIAEAYAIGGWFLLALSPFWMAVSFGISYILLMRFMNSLVFDNLEYSKRIVALGGFSYISMAGGFADLMFFKNTIMMLLLLLPFLLSFYMLKVLSVHLKMK